MGGRQTFLSALALATGLVLAGLCQPVVAQGSVARTGNPLIDSILEAPGPRHLGERRHERDDWRDDEWDEEDDRDWRRTRPARERDFDRREPYLGERAPRARALQVMPPPPLPEARGEPPASVAAATELRDAEPGGMETRDPDARDLAAIAEPPAERTAPGPVEEAGAEETPGEETAGEETAALAPDDRRPSASTTPDAAQPQADAEPQPQEHTATTDQPATTSAPVRTQSPAAPGPALEQMIGQMLIVGFEGQTPRDEGVRLVAEQLRDGKIGGVIFMSHNITSPQQVLSLTKLFAEAGKGQPAVLIAVDQEGGYVQRLERTKGFETHPSAARLGVQNDPEAAYAAYRSLALELRKHGFNINFGPVLDLELNPQNPIIARLRRSYGADPRHVASFARAFIFAHHDSGVLTAVKHFPGHGSSTEDSHTTLPDLSQSWSDAELGPYSELIGTKLVDMVMTGHLYHPNFSDRPGLPASLSAKAISTVLRERMGYDGVVITDDLDMAGVRRTGKFAENVLRAVQAGNDILLITNISPYRADLQDQVASVILNAVENGTLSRERLEQSYQRITALKTRLPSLGSDATISGAPGTQAARPGG